MLVVCILLLSFDYDIANLETLKDMEENSPRFMIDIVCNSKENGVQALS